MTWNEFKALVDDKLRAAGRDGEVDIFFAGRDGEVDIFFFDTGNYPEADTLDVDLCWDGDANPKTLAVCMGGSPEPEQDEAKP